MNNKVLYPLPKGASKNDPKMIILHAMGEWIHDKENYYYATEWLKHLGLSAHALITPSGVTIKCRAEVQGAYHAKGHNTDTLGVEFLVPGVHTYDSFLRTIKEFYITEPQYLAGIRLVRQWMITHNIKKDGIKTHQQIDPERKYDPGEGFPLYKFLDEL